MDANGSGTGPLDVRQVNIMRLVGEESHILTEITRDGDEGRLRQQTNENAREHAHIDLNVLVRDASGAVVNPDD